MAQQANSRTWNTRIQNKRDTAANWGKAEAFKPLEGEIIVYLPDADVKYPRFKVGDGKNFLKDLPFSESVYKSNFTVTENFGRYAANTEVPAAGKTASELIADAFCQDKQPTITLPSVNSIGVTGDGVYEVGEIVNVSYKVNFNAGKYTYDATTGVTQSKCYVKGYGRTEFEEYTNGTTVEHVVTHGDNGSVSAKVDYSDGNLAHTQLGEESTLKISAGTTSEKTNTTEKITGVYPTYYGVITKDLKLSSSNIQSFIDSETTVKKKNTEKNSNYSYTTENQHPVIAYPAEYGELTKIIDPNNFTQGWEKSELKINHSISGNTVQYYIYVGGASTASNIKYTFS